MVVVVQDAVLDHREHLVDGEPVLEFEQQAHVSPLASLAF